MPTDVGGFDPLSVSMRDYVDGGNSAHESFHAREREANAAVVEANNLYARTVINDHFSSHEMQHEAVKIAFDNYLREVAEYKASHQQSHRQDEEAVKVALEAVAKLADLHASAHANEHHAHERVHERELQASDLARKDLDNRLAEFNAYRAQQREQAQTFMPRTEIIALIDRVQSAIDVQGKTAEAAHLRMDGISSERLITVQSQIDKLNLQAATNVGASQRTTYLIGAGFTFITILITIVSIYLNNIKH